MWGRNISLTNNRLEESLGIGEGSDGEMGACWRTGTESRSDSVQSTAAAGRPSPHEAQDHVS